MHAIRTRRADIGSGAQHPARAGRRQRGRPWRGLVAGGRSRALGGESVSRSGGVQLVGYFDESGHSAGTDFFALAAFVAEDTDWVAFDSMWRDALREAGAPYLHMREFAHSLGPFSGWAEARRRGLLAGCITAINSVPATAVGATMSTACFAALPEEARSALRDPFYCCFQEVVRGVAVAACLTPPGNRVSMVFSRQDEFGSSAQQLWNVMAETIDVKHRMGPLSFNDMREVPALQAADLLAYELRHHYHLRRVRSTAAARWPFVQIVRHQRAAYNARMLKYLPAWYLQAQADGSFDELMSAMLSNPEKHRPQLCEMFPRVE